MGSERVVLQASDTVSLAAVIPHSESNATGKDCWMYLAMDNDER